MRECKKKNVIVSLGLYKSSGGPSKSVKAFQQALDADVVSWVSSDKSMRESLIWNETLVVEGSRLPFFKQLQVPKFRSAASAEKAIADAGLVSVHSFWRWHVPWVHQACRRHHVPYWFVPHGSLDPYVVNGKNSLFKRFFLSVAGRKFLDDAETVIFSSEREREKALPLLSHGRTEVIKWPLKAGDFGSCDPIIRQETRDQLGIPNEAVCFLYFGRLSSMKQPLQTIQAFAQSGLNKVHLLVVGNEFDVTLEECRREASRWGVTDRTHIVGPVYGANKSAILNAADVYVSLSFRENFNFTAAEALASGLNLILSEGNDLGPELANLSGVHILPDGNLDSAARMMQQLGSVGPSLLAEDSLARIHWASQNFGSDTFVQKLRAAAQLHRLTSG